MKKLEKIIDNPHEKLTLDQYESMSVNIQLSRVKSYISIVVLIMLFLAYIFIRVLEIKSKELQGSNRKLLQVESWRKVRGGGRGVKVKS